MGGTWDDWEGTRDDVTDRRGVARVFVLGALAGILVLGLVWVSVSLLDDNSRVADAPEQAASPVVAEPEPGGDNPAEAMPAVRRTRLDRCEVAASRLALPLEAARPTMDQWQIHVGAMNKLIVGEITLQQATDFWDRTRVGAHRKIGRFADAVQPVDREGLNCPVTSRLGQASAALRSCAHQVTLDHRALESGRQAILTWEHHVHDMDLLRLGQISPAEATQAWLASWEKGQREIDAYKGDRRAANRSDAC